MIATEIEDNAFRDGKTIWLNCFVVFQQKIKLKSKCIWLVSRVFFCFFGEPFSQAHMWRGLLTLFAYYLRRYEYMPRGCKALEQHCKVYRKTTEK